MADLQKLDKPSDRNLIERVLGEGYSQKEIDDVIGAAENPEQARGDLAELAEHYEPGTDPIPKAPRAPLAPHEQGVYEDVIHGDMEPKRVV